ncbi:hypothetical protein BU26DRAFT_345658 [Trematosphaeria pertusa]|uniref:Uncharacterized protein n=1 Tax=Trematosphaeria pertusa TaxID=390896 RepID=A0A6A6IA82_9PLEO|nr:uncharacterized protein BU26DRAFT_345658 [Trematosphaeria pertusa]KAF2247291.1 hypothetical protein BU26DRAFT_345658 [Trematosphaeria pertusa]
MDECLRGASGAVMMNGHDGLCFVTGSWLGHLWANCHSFRYDTSSYRRILCSVGTIALVQLTISLLADNYLLFYAHPPTPSHHAPSLSPQPRRAT